METTREEALDLLNKWLAERTPLDCVLSFSTFGARFPSLLERVTPEAILLRSARDASELRLPLGPSLEFAFGEPVRDLVTLVFVFRSSDEGNDFISLIGAA